MALSDRRNGLHHAGRSRHFQGARRRARPHREVRPRRSRGEDPWLLFLEGSARDHQDEADDGRPARRHGAAARCGGIFASQRGFIAHGHAERRVRGIAALTLMETEAASSLGWVALLPHVNASLNALATCLLITGYIQIKRY